MEGIFLSKLQQFPRYNVIIRDIQLKLHNMTFTPFDCRRIECNGAMKIISFNRSEILNIEYCYNV